MIQTVKLNDDQHHGQYIQITQGTPYNQHIDRAILVIIMTRSTLSIWTRIRANIKSNHRVFFTWYDIIHFPSSPPRTSLVHQWPLTVSVLVLLSPDSSSVLVSTDVVVDPSVTDCVFVVLSPIISSVGSPTLCVPRRCRIIRYRIGPLNLHGPPPSASMVQWNARSYPDPKTRRQNREMTEWEWTKNTEWIKNEKYDNQHTVVHAQMRHETRDTFTAITALLVAPSPRSLRVLDKVLLQMGFVAIKVIKVLST